MGCACLLASFRNAWQHKVAFFFFWVNVLDVLCGKKSYVTFSEPGFGWLFLIRVEMFSSTEFAAISVQQKDFSLEAF